MSKRFWSLLFASLLAWQSSALAGDDYDWNDDDDDTGEKAATHDSAAHPANSVTLVASPGFSAFNWPHHAAIISAAIVLDDNDPRSPAARLFVARRNGRIVGSITLDDDDHHGIAHARGPRIDGDGNSNSAGDTHLARRLARAAMRHCRARGSLKLCIACDGHEPAVHDAAAAEGFLYSRTRITHNPDRPVLEFYRNLYHKPPRNHPT